MTTSTQRLPQPRSSQDSMLPTVVAERFAVGGVIRRTAATTTAAATDSTTGRQVVVKMADARLLAPATRIRLLHEAEVLRSLGDELLVPLLAAGETDGLLYFVMPRLAGQSLQERLRGGPLGAALTLQVAEEVLTALSVAHRQRVLHRDIKPSNVVVSDDVPPLVRLVDWGLARSDRLDASIRDEPVGTAMYMSPEQAGLLRHEVDERSDLYSLGVVLHECLAGTPPFTGSTVGEVLRQHLSTTPPDLRALDSSIPAALSELVRRLLRKDPRDRYQTADGVLADVRMIRAALDDGDPDPELVLGVHDVRKTLTEPILVGRRGELGQLLAVADRAAGDVFLVEAESGGGKSRLLDEVALRLAETGALVLRGQGVDQAARLPYQLLDGVVRDLVSATEDETGIRRRLREQLATEAESIVAALPQSAPLFSGATPAARQAPEEFGEARTLAALSRLLDCLAADERRTVLLLDDCQWADEATIALLARWRREHRQLDGVGGLAVIAAFRGEEVPDDHPLRRVTPFSLRLRPLGAPDVAALVDSMAGEVPRAAVAAVQRLSDGSPFMAGAVLRGLVETGALYFEAGAWQVEESLLESVQSSHEAAVLLSRRLELLPEDVVRLLEVGAVLGKRFELDAAARLAELDSDTALARLHLIGTRHIVWLEPGAATATFVHDKLREVLLGQLDPARRRELHRVIAEDLEAREQASAYDLAFHFCAAGEPQRALPHALTAAAEARARHSLAAAEEQYRIAMQGLAPGDAALQFRVAAGLGDVLMLRGKYAESEACMKEALGFAASRGERAEIELRLGELAFKRGDIPDSVVYLEAAIRALGRRVPRGHLGYTLYAIWEALVQVAHTVLPRRWIARRSLDRAESDLLAAHIYSRLAYSYWFSKGREPTAWAHLREMNLLERYPATLELAQAYSEHAPVASTFPWFSRGVKYAERSLRIRREFGDVWGQGQSLHFYGVVLYSSSQFREAIERLTEAIRLLERTGDQWEINTAMWHVGFARYRLGEFDEARRALERCYASAVELGDHQAKAIALSGLSKISGGDVDAQLVADALAATAGDLHTTGELITGEAIRLLRAGEPLRAAQVLADGYRQVSKARIRNEYVAAILPWRVTALRSAAEATDRYDVRRRDQLLREARRVAWRARLVATAYRNNLPHVLREQALLALLRGRERRAEALLRRASDVAARQSMTAELDAIEQIRDRPRSPQPAPASATGFDRVAPVSLSLADRFDGLLTVGRRIATALTPEAVWATVRIASLELLRGDEAAIVLVDDAGDGPPALVPVDGSNQGTSEQLMRRAVDTGGVVCWTDDDADPTESMLLNRTRSALAAPVYRRGQLVGCWYVSHASVGTLFGPDEVRLAEFISALAGAAMENAEGFAEVQALSRTLEQRVADRTAELERANRELRRLDELKSEFVAMTSHELRSPLTSILGFCRTALRHWDRIDDDRKREFITTIERQGSRLSVLTEDLLQMARIESGHLRTTLAAVDLRALCEEVTEEFSARSTAIVVDGEAAVALADRDHVHRIVINLVDNALKYGEPPVQVSVAREGDRVQLSVRDHGPGVPPDFVPRLFDRFAQASSGPTRQATGTGLGMAIVRGLAEAMSATIAYDPVPGGGARFVVDLPAA